MDSKDVAVSNSTPYISDGDAVLVGMPRLRQLRVMKGKQRVLMTRESIYSIYIYIYINTCILGRTYSVERSIHLIEEHYIYIYIFKLAALILVIPLNMFNVYMSRKLLSVL